jgi:LAS superfamily LD-carboxypeptidase LdcB
MLTDATASGINLKVNSAYRTYDDQVRVAGNSGGIPAASPGTSNHGFGLAVDLANINGTRININGMSGNKPIPKTIDEWKWIQANKAKYGFDNINSTTESHHYNYIK